MAYLCIFSSLNLNNFDDVRLIGSLFLLALDEDNFLALFAKMGVFGDLIHHFEESDVISERANFVADHAANCLELLDNLFARAERKDGDWRPVLCDETSKATSLSEHDDEIDGEVEHGVY